MNFPSTESSPIFLLEPNSQAEIMSAMQKLKERYIVIVNLAHLEPERARQAADMMAGCSCAIEGKTTWLGKQTYMYTPNNIYVNRNA